jgi:hypothetical protein
MTWNQSFRHTRVEHKNMMVCEMHLHLALGRWILFLCTEPSTPLSTCDAGNSRTNEPTLIEIWSKHLDANLSQGRRWLWREVEKKDATGPSRMMHAVWQPCGRKDNWGWLKFSVVPTQNFTLECIITSPDFADFFSGCCVFHAVQDWKSLIKSYVRPGHWTSSDYWNIWRLENGGKWCIIDGLVPTMCVSAQKIETS